MSSVTEMSGLTDPSVQDDPFEYYAGRMAQCPVWHEDDIDLWVIGGLAEAREALQDVATFSSTPARSRRASEAQIAYHQMLVEHGWPRQATLQRTDPPVHTRYRKLVNRVFTPAAVREFTPHIDEIACELVDAIAERGECEFVADFALPLPGIFIAEQLGLDRARLPHVPAMGGRDARPREPTADVGGGSHGRGGDRDRGPAVPGRGVRPSPRPSRA